MKYEIKDIYGHIRKTTDMRDEALGWYAWLTKNFGYAEVWYGDELIIKTF